MTKSSKGGGHRKPAAASTLPLGGGRRRTAIVLVLAIVMVSTLAAHWPVTRAKALIFDDDEYVTDNALVKNPSWQSVERFFCEVLAPSTVSGYYQPLAMVSLMVDYALGARPLEPRGFHISSLALHAVNAGLVFLLVLLLFRDLFAAAAAALVFGLHPMTVEPIAWVAERKTLLAALFSLACLVVYVAGASGEPGKKKGWGGYLACMGLYLAALLSKPSATPLPLAMLLLDIWPLNRFGRRALLEKLPFLALAGLFAVITVVSQARTAGIVAPQEYPATALPLLLCHNIVFYPLKLLWPAGLTAYYPFPRPLGLSHPNVLAGVIGTAILVGVAAVSLRRTRAALVCVLIFFALLAPTMGIIGFTPVIAADRFVYLPMVGLLIVLAWGLSRASTGQGAGSSKATRLRAGLYLIGGLIAVACVAEAVQTRRYLAAWSESEGLFRHMLAHAPQTAILYRGLGNELKKKGRIDESVDAFQRAIELANDHVAHSNLAVLLAARGQVDEAIYHGQQAVRAQPKWPTGFNNLGNALIQKGRHAEAEAAFEKAIELRPDYAEAFSNLGMAYAHQGDLAKAVEQYRRAVALNADMANTHHNWADAALQQGDSDQAVAHFQEALRLSPKLAASWIGLGDALRLARRWNEALNSYQEALRAEPGNAEAREKYAALLRQM
jgi:tetratricopeptide (TPR) repeat protein